MRFGVGGLLLVAAAADPQDLYASFTTEPQFDGIYSYVAPGSGWVTGACDVHVR